MKLLSRASVLFYFENKHWRVKDLPLVIDKIHYIEHTFTKKCSCPCFRARHLVDIWFMNVNATVGLCENQAALARAQYFDGWEEEERISALGWRMTYLGARMTNDVSRRFSTDTGHVLAVKALRYVVLHSGAEICRSSSSRRVTTFFIRAPRYVLLPLNRRFRVRA